MLLKCVKPIQAGSSATVSEQVNISECFYSLQGESTWTGFPCAFIRLSDCNLRCSYCDAAYTYEEQGKAMTIAEILQWLRQYPEVLVEITGGEPLLQERVYPLFEQLLTAGRTVLLETNGSLPIDRVPTDVSIILDIKCPASGMMAHFDRQNLVSLKTRKDRGCRDEIKFVLSSEKDFFWAASMVREHDLTQLSPVLFSPVQTLLKPEHLARLILDHQLPVRLQLQMHTILWPDIKRGI